jgi:Protein of unknown function (DUF1501)
MCASVESWTSGIGETSNGNNSPDETDSRKGVKNRLHEGRCGSSLEGMLSLTGRPERACDGFTRREVLRVGGISALGLSLPGLLASRTDALSPESLGPGWGKARACLLVYLFGGPSQIDIWDMKPDAPAQFRGEFRPIATSVPGTVICEHMPRLASAADTYCLIRGMSHEHPRHGWGLYYMLTGRKHSRPDLDAPPTPEDFPGIGALVSRLVPARPDVPTAVTLPRWNRFNDLPNDYAGERAGFLGGAFNPWLVAPRSGSESLQLEVPLDVPPASLARRKGLLRQLDQSLARWSESAQEFDTLHQQAYAMIASSEVRRAFRVEDEPAVVRDRYGTHPFGQGLLLARRLIEAGTKLVQVNWHNDGSDVKSPFWDTHKDNFNSLKTRLIPPVDVGLSALLQDLGARGLLDETLVVVMGEFGRTPRIGQVIMNAATDASGRDHWPHAYTVLVAGGGVRGGYVHGATDDRAAHVVDGRVSPPDLHATILHALGINPSATFADRRGRSQRASTGRPVVELFS